MAGLNRTGRNLNKNEKFLIGVLGVIAVGTLIFTFIIEPSDKKLKPLKEEVKAKQEQVKNLDMIQLSIAKKEKELEGLKEKYDEASKTIPKTDRYPQVVKDLEAMAVQAGVKINTRNFGKPAVYSENNNGQSATGLTAFTVGLGINGDYNQILDFIKILESDTRILEIPTLSITTEGASISIIYYTSGGVEEENYDFNTGTYGKGNLFE